VGGSIFCRVHLEAHSHGVILRDDYVDACASESGATKASICPPGSYSNASGAD
jgi:hypothetical protein